jgi:ABC-type Fe3+/spermidine/putrescine transport system ATPase subunit
LKVKKEVVVVLGEVGSGKTTLLNLISGIVTPDSGRIVLSDEKTYLNHISLDKRNVGYVLQRLYLFPHLNVIENVQFGLKRHQKKKKDEKANLRLQNLISTLGIESLLNRKVQSLSGGQQQKVALARTLLMEPKVLLLDEPLSNLDIVSKLELISNFKSIFTTLQIPIIYVTHHPKEAFSLAARIVILNNGKVIEEGTRDEVMLKPKTKFAKVIMENL